jgi:hypothetical protein
VFVIMVVINFVVITKGAGRIAEVSARFTLDAMPGKQMAIDADLNAGLIGEDEARKRRAVIAQEADFYGSMDGASKFVRGDAVAGLPVPPRRVKADGCVGKDPADRFAGVDGSECAALSPAKPRHDCLMQLAGSRDAWTIPATCRIQ